VPPFDDSATVDATMISPGSGHPHDAGCKVDGDAADVVRALLDLSDVEASAALETEITGRVAKLHRSGDGFGARRECRRRSVTGAFHTAH
jgi:hypothetical protein